MKASQDAPGTQEELQTLVQESSFAPAPEGQPEATEAPEEPRRRRWLTVLLAAVVACVGCYLAGAVLFMNVFMPNTSLNDQDVSLKSASEIAAAASDAAGDFELTVEGESLDLTITAADIKASYDGNAFARAAIAQQHPWTWPLQIAGSHELVVEQTLAFDAARLTDIVGSAVDAANADATPSVDASVAYDDQTKHYEVKSEEQGTELDKSAVIATVRAALGKREQQVELSEDDLVKPEITSDDESLNEAAKKANACLDATQTLVVGDTTVAEVGTDELQKWVKLADDLSIGFDSEACTKWAQGDLSKKIDTYGSTRTYTRPDGASVTVSGGTYGWICDGAAIAGQIAENVQKGSAATIEVPWKQKGEAYSSGGQDWGARYIDIDLGEQHVRLYDGGSVVWEADCVSGGLDTVKNVMHSTPTGVYSINSNMRSGNIKLTGKTDPVTLEPEYISYVDYWMPFIDDSVALHDADWRSSFGGSIYRSNGSHGCVNLPSDKARELYGIVDVGTVVVVHD